MVIEFGKPVNHLGEEIDVEVDLGAAQKFCTFNKKENSLTIDSERMSEDNIGVYSIFIKASEIQFGQKYEYERKFYLQIKPQIVEVD